MLDIIGLAMQQKVPEVDAPHHLLPGRPQQCSTRVDPGESRPLTSSDLTFEEWLLYRFVITYLLLKLLRPSEFLSPPIKHLGMVIA